MHGSGGPDRYGLLAERGSVGSQPAGTLQCDGFGVECAREHHGAIERHHPAGIIGKRRESPHYLTGGVEHSRCRTG